MEYGEIPSWHLGTIPSTISDVHAVVGTLQHALIRKEARRVETCLSSYMSRVLSTESGFFMFPLCPDTIVRVHALGTKILPRHVALKIPRKMVYDAINELKSFDTTKFGAKITNVFKKFGVSNPESLLCVPLQFRKSCPHADLLVCFLNKRSTMEKSEQFKPRDIKFIKEFFTLPLFAKLEQLQKNNNKVALKNALNQSKSQINVAPCKKPPVASSLQKIEGSLQSLPTSSSESDDMLILKIGAKLLGILKNSEELLRLACIQLENMLDAESCTIFTTCGRDLVARVFGWGARLQEVAYLRYHPLGLELDASPCESARRNALINRISPESLRPGDHFLDEQAGYATSTLLCVPITDADHRVVGVLALKNKLGSPCFSIFDEEIARREIVYIRRLL